jgi:multiple sugar transport system substrate-binding protein
MRGPRNLMNSGAPTRRAVGLGLAAGAGLLAAPRLARAEGTSLRFWTSQTAPVQMKAWETIFANFATQNKGLKVEIEKYSDDNLWPKLTAAIAARDVPDLISYVQAYTVVTLGSRGLVEPFDDVIKGVGEDDFFPSMRDIYKVDGRYLAGTLNNQTSSNLFYRKDLLQEAGLAPPKTWDELLAVAKATSRSGMYGTVLPYGRSSMTSTMMAMFVRQAGGNILNPDLSVGFNSDATVAALEFLKEIFEYNPPGAASYSWSEVLNAIVTGKAATGPYTGRPLALILEQNPSIGDKISRVPYPYRKDGRPAYDCPFNSLFIPKGSANVEGAKALAKALYAKEAQIAVLHTLPGHNLPALKSVATAKEFYDNPVIGKFKPEVEGMIETTAQSRNLVKESDKHAYNQKAGDIFNSLVLAETVQNVVVEKMAPKQAAERGADKIAAILKG